MIKQPQKILLISSGQPSLNPRLVKEADALTEAGYGVKVLYAYWNPSGTVLDQKLLPKKKWKFLRVAGSPKQQKWTYLISRIIHKWACLTARKIKPALFSDLTLARSSFYLIKYAKKESADLYIAHNLGALPAAIKAAALHGKPCGFDAEDFHRNEVSNNPQHFDVRLKTYIEQKYIPKTAYTTASSPEIAAAYQQLFPTIKPIVIHNVFNSPKLLPPKLIHEHSPLKLFWFSQTIGCNRGIENVIRALNQLRDGIFELHLLGELQKGLSKAYFEKLTVHGRYSLHFHHLIDPDNLIPFSAQFDIGLALEPAFSLNNDMALSNKIFTYMQAGLAIIASSTTAQRNFMHKHPGMGQVYPLNDPAALEMILNTYAADRKLVSQHQQQSTQYARTTLNWEQEKKKFLEVVKNTLNPVKPLKSPS